MKKKLTAKIIDELVPAKGQPEIRDEEVSGLSIRVSEGGSRTWTLKYRSTGGRQRRLTLGRYPHMSVAKARREAAQVKLQARAGNDPAGDRDAKRAERTLRELIEERLKDSKAQKLAPHTLEVQASYAKNVDPRLLSKPISSITVRDIEALHHKLTEKREDELGRDRGGIYAANCCIHFLRTTFNKAISWGWLAGANPCKNVKLHHQPKRKEFLSVEQIAAVSNSLMSERDWRWKAYFPLTLMAGTRKSELLRARWGDVDFKQRVIRIPRTKSGEPHELHYGDADAAIIESLPSRDNSEWLFPSDRSKVGHVTYPDYAWRRIRKRAGVPKARIHDLRHTMATQMHLIGYDMKSIQVQLNHSDISMTARYVGISAEAQRAAVNKTAHHMGFSAPLAAIDVTPSVEVAPAHEAVESEDDALAILRDSQVG